MSVVRRQAVQTRPMSAKVAYIHDDPVISRLIRIESRLVKLGHKLGVDLGADSDIKLVPPALADSVVGVELPRRMIPIGAIIDACVAAGHTKGVVEVRVEGRHVADIYLGEEDVQAG